MQTLNQIITAIASIRDAIKQKIASKRDDLLTLDSDYYNSLSPLTDAFEDYPELTSELVSDLEIEFKQIGFNSMPKLLKDSLQTSLTLVDTSYLWGDYIDINNSLYAQITFLPKLDWYTTNNTKFQYQYYNGSYNTTSGMPVLMYCPGLTVSNTNISRMFSGCNRLLYVHEIKPTVNVTSMQSLFNGCSRLKHPGIDFKDFGYVQDASNLFNGANDLETVDVSEWDTSNITTLLKTFYQCKSLNNIDTSNWNLSNCTSVGNIFDSCIALEDLDTSKWNLPTQSSYLGMFNACRSLKELDLSGWEFDGSTTTFNSMFSGCNKLTTLNRNIPVTSSCTNINSIYSNCDKLTGIDTTDWDTSNVVDATSVFEYLPEGNTLTKLTFNGIYGTSYMYRECKSLYNLDISDWTFTTITKGGSLIAPGFNYLCDRASNLQTVTGFNDPNDDRKFSYIIGFNYSFNFCTELTTFETGSINLTNCTSFENAFCGDYNLISIDLSGWETNNVQNISSMFLDCYNLTLDKGILSIDLSGWNIGYQGYGATAISFALRNYKLMTFTMDNATMTDMYSLLSMFCNCSALTSISFLNTTCTFSNLLKYSTTVELMFLNCSSLQTINLSGFDFSNCGTFLSMFNGCSSLLNLTINLGQQNRDFSARAMFYGCLALKSLNISNWDLSKCTNLERLLADAGDGTSKIDTSLWVLTSKLKAVSHMFAGCKMIDRFEPISFDTTNITSFNGMFNTSTLTYFKNGISFVNKSDCTNMFKGTDVTSIDISKFKISIGKSMFDGCSDLTEVIFKSGNNVTTLEGDCTYMFYGCSSLTNFVGFDEIDTSKVTNFYYFLPVSVDIDLSIIKTDSCTTIDNSFPIFRDLDLTGWDVSKCTRMLLILKGDGSDTNVYNVDISGWRFNSSCSLSRLFISTKVNLTAKNLTLNGVNADLILTLSNIHNLYIDSSFFSNTSKTTYSFSWVGSVKVNDISIDSDSIHSILTAMSEVTDNISRTVSGLRLKLGAITEEDSTLLTLLENSGKWTIS